MKRIAAIIIIQSTFAFTSDEMVIPKQYMFATNLRHKVTLDKDGFSVHEAGKKYRVQDYDLDESLRCVTTKQDLRNLFRMDNVQKHRIMRKMIVSRVGKDYALRTQDTLNGQGPILGAILGGIVKAIGYGVVGACVNRAAKTITDGASGAVSHVIPKPELDTIVMGLDTIGTVGPLVVTQNPAPVVVTNWIDNNAQARPEFYKGVTDGGAAVIAAAAAEGQCAFTFIDAAAAAAAAWGTSLPTP